MLPFPTGRLYLHLRPTACLAALSLAAGCGGDSNEPNPPAQGQTIYAVDLANRFALFHSANPGTVNRDLAITGLLTGDRIVGIDFRPVDGKLYGVGTDSRVYTLDTVTAVASPVGASFTPALDGDHFGVALDPATDRIRIQSAESGQNLRLDPATGQVTNEDVALAYAAGDEHAGSAPGVVATAITTGGTYGIDWLFDEFVVMSDPNSGQLTTVGGTNVVTAPCAALDVASDGVLFASMTTGGINSLYTMNVTTGTASLLGAIDQVASIQSIAIAPGSTPLVSDREAMAVTALQSRAGLTSRLPARARAGSERYQARNLRAAKGKLGPKSCL